MLLRGGYYSPTGWSPCAWTQPGKTPEQCMREPRPSGTDAVAQAEPGAEGIVDEDPQLGRRLEIAADVKDLERELVDLGQRVNTLEQTHDAQEEELDCHRRELFTLQDKNQELQYQLNDLENRSRRSNIRIKGVPA
ncbi:hypothetical protein NDU88_002569 [Pleurodeles waltl]|uniref:Uncharacterized protein n=1 Tax=Pleurodeles waltl TaxID=8319 RepID=A0AAV7SBB1_PLEWA|nr:hypothetical protein NDU88_002569 [Pleurodeles waltl]